MPCAINIHNINILSMDFMPKQAIKRLSVIHFASKNFINLVHITECYQSLPMISSPFFGTHVLQVTGVNNITCRDTDPYKVAAAITFSCQHNLYQDVIPFFHTLVSHSVLTAPRTPRISGTDPYSQLVSFISENTNKLVHLGDHNNHIPLSHSLTSLSKRYQKDIFLSLVGDVHFDLQDRI